MKGREGGKGGGAPPQAAELLVCFPPRASLTLLPKPSISSSSSSDHHHHHQKKVSSSGDRAVCPTLWAKAKPTDSEPTSPKVTCAGQIKVRPKPSSWQSVMEEIEKLHRHNKKHEKTKMKKNNKRRLNWVDSFSFKKDIITMQFLTCLQTLRFDFRCFGSLPNSDITSDDEDIENSVETNEEEEEEESSRTDVFSKWFMVFQENQNRGKYSNYDDELDFGADDDDDGDESCAAAPPPNALLLMRSRSAPSAAKTFLDDEEREAEEEKQNLELAVEDEEEKMKEEAKERLLVMDYYDSDFYKISSDIAKETWVVGGIKDLLSRSRSSKR